MIDSLPQPPRQGDWTLSVRWIFPVDQPPLRDGTITLRGERIVAVEPRGTRKPDADLGNAALLPGLVNPHVHLDLSDAAGRCLPQPDFTQWLRRVVQHRHSQTPEDVDRAIRLGIDQCLRFGTTLVGDIAVRGQSWAALAESPLRSVVFYEMLGLTQERAAEAWRLAQTWLAGRTGTATTRPAISLHAPYSVRRTFFKELGALAGALPVAIHVAESREEMELLESRSGPFVDFLQQRGVWDAQGLVPGIEEVLDSGTSRTLFVHGNYLTPGVHALRGTLIYCPRTHAAFRHPRHPFRDYLARGTRVALATDSLASNPDLDLLAEARFVRRLHPDLAGDILLRMITLSGAEALAWEQEAGSLTPGKSADVVAVSLETDADEPYSLLFDQAGPVIGTLFRGRWRAESVRS